MDLPTQRLIAATRRLLLEISELRSSIDALREQGHRQNRERRSEEAVSNIHPLRVDAEVRESLTTQGERRVREDRNFWLQVALAIGTWLAFLAAAIYAGIAAGQLRTSEQLFVEVQKQTDMMKRQGEAIAAVLKPDIETRIDPVPNYGYATVQLSNIGHIPASDVRVDLKIGKMSLPDETLVGKETPWAFTIPEITSENPGNQDHQIDLSTAEQAAIKTTKLTVRIQGSVTYYDGFMEKTFQVCEMHLWVESGATPPAAPTNQPISCAEFSDQLRVALKRKRAEEAKH